MIALNSCKKAYKKTGSNEYNVTNTDDMPKNNVGTRKGRRYWIFLVLIPFLAISVIFSLLVYFGIAQLNQLVTYLIVTTIAIAIAYYLRTIPSSKLWRGVWIMIGVGIIGAPIAITLGLLFHVILTPITNGVVSYVLAYVIAVVLGVVLGDKIGKKRDYRPLG
jgi:hypothetical protein